MTITELLHPRRTASRARERNAFQIGADAQRFGLLYGQRSDDADCDQRVQAIEAAIVQLTRVRDELRQMEGRD